MTHITHPAPALNLEAQAQSLGQRYSLTSAEREGISRDAHALIRQYELRGGQHGTRWLEQHAGLTHSTAVNLRRAGRALSAGAKGGQGVSKLAQVGRWLELGKPLIEAQHLADDAEARKKAAEEAGIGVASVKYASGMTGEMASAYQQAVNVYATSGVSIPPLPELTVELVRRGASHLTRADVRAAELGETIEQQAQQPRAALDFYAWLRDQPGPQCDNPRCVGNWQQYHHVLTRHGRRGHTLDHFNVLRLCHYCHQTGGASAVHGPVKEREWLTQAFGSPEQAWELIWERTARYAQYLKENV